MKIDLYTSNLTVNFSDVNENNEMTNRGFLRVMQETAGVHSSLLGYGISDTPKTKLAWIVLNWKLKVFSRPKTNDSITVKTWVKYSHSLFSYRDFEVYDANNTLVAIASSKWVLFNVDNQMISKMPEDLIYNSASNYKSVFDTILNEKIKEPEDSKLMLDYLVQRRDIDTNHHVNNLFYLDYAYEALPFDVYKNRNFTNIEIMYKHEIKLGDTISLLYSHTQNNEHIITIKNKVDCSLHSIIKLY